MKRRPRRSLPATLVAMAGLAASALIATSAIQLLLSKPQLIRFSTAAETAHGLSWNEIPVAVVGGAAGALGLLLLLAAVLPGRPTVLPLTETPSESPLDVGAHRSGLHATLRAAVRSVDGVAGTKLKLSRRKISAKVKTDRTNTDGLADAVRAALEQRLDQIALAQNPQIRVRVASSRSSR